MMAPSARAAGTVTPGAARGTGAAVIAIVGAESTGKTTLARDLALRVAHDTGLRCAAVDEWLRAWCLQQRRTPRADEQRGIAAEQARRIETAARDVDVLVCDTTPLMTAVYSQLLFDDRSLTPEALAWQQAHCHLTLLTATDLGWVADGWMRDGPAVQQRVDAALRSVLLASTLPWCVVGGSGPARAVQAVAAVAPLLAPLLGPLLAPPPSPTNIAARGLFSGLHAERRNQNESNGDGTWAYRCPCCDSPEHERAAMLARRRERRGARG